MVTVLLPVILTGAVESIVFPFTSIMPVYVCTGMGNLADRTREFSIAAKVYQDLATHT